LRIPAGTIAGAFAKQSGKKNRPAKKMRKRVQRPYRACCNRSGTGVLFSYFERRRF